METKGRYRAYCWTVNNYTRQDEDDIQKIECKFLQYGKEICPTTGTPHLQGYIYFTNQKAFNVVRKLIRGHITPCNGSPQSNIKYTGKENNVFTKGEPPQDPTAQGEVERERWKAMRLSAIEGRFHDIPDQEYIRYQSSFKRIHMEDGPKPTHLPEMDHYIIWIYGPTGVGKSHYAAEHWPDAYLKDNTIWWDDYKGQKVARMDEVSPRHFELVDYIKKWGDRWVFTGQRKGGRVEIRPELLVITSQYRIGDIFTHPEDKAAILRRTKVIHIPERGTIVEVVS